MLQHHPRSLGSQSKAGQESKQLLGTKTKEKEIKGNYNLSGESGVLN